MAGKESMVVKLDDGTVMFPTKLVKAMLGGKWPDNPDDFAFDAVDHYRLVINSDYSLLFVGYDGGAPTPGPVFQIIIGKTDDPANTCALEVCNEGSGE